MYINGIGAISPQPLEEGIKIPTAKEGKVMAVEPDYSTWIDPRLLRRMSRIVSMGVTAAFMALKDAGVKMPDAIATGTGFGCLEDTGTFLTKLIRSKTKRGETRLRLFNRHTIPSAHRLLCCWDVMAITKRSPINPFHWRVRSWMRICCLLKIQCKTF